MSFSTNARRASDPAVPLPHRLSSFRSCVRRFKAVPYEDAMRYLRLMAGPFEHDERALVAAVELLLLLRARWKAQVETFAAIRRVQKRRGLRRPRGTTPFGGGLDSPQVLLELHTPRGAERGDVQHLLPGGRRPQFDGSSFALAAPTTPRERAPAQPPRLYDGRSFELSRRPEDLRP